MQLDLEVQDRAEVLPKQRFGNTCHELGKWPRCATVHYRLDKWEVNNDKTALVELENFINLSFLVLIKNIW